MLSKDIRIFTSFHQDEKNVYRPYWNEFRLPTGIILSEELQLNRLNFFNMLMRFLMIIRKKDIESDTSSVTSCREIRLTYSIFGKSEVGLKQFDFVQLRGRISLF